MSLITKHGFQVVTVEDLWRDAQCCPLDSKLDTGSWYKNEYLPLVQQLREALNKYWITTDSGGEGSQIIVSGMWVENWSVCGGIFDVAPLTPLFVKTVSDVLENSRYPNYWSYNSYIEITEVEHPANLTKVLIKNGSLYVENNGKDYSAFYE